MLYSIRPEISSWDKPETISDDPSLSRCRGSRSSTKPITVTDVLTLDAITCFKVNEALVLRKNYVTEVRISCFLLVKAIHENDNTDIAADDQRLNCIADSDIRHQQIGRLVIGLGHRDIIKKSRRFR